MKSRVVAAWAALVLGASVSPWVAPAAADPLPADYAGSTDNDIIGMDLNLFGFNLAGVDVAHTVTAVDSTASPRSEALSSNLAATVAGLNVPIASVSQSAPPDHTTATTGGLTQVDVPGLLDTGVITGSALARWAGDAACLPSGTALSSSSVQMAGLTVGNATTEVLQLGAATTSGTTSLVANGGAGDDRSVVSTSTGSIASLTLLNDAIRVAIAGTPTVTATASGDPGGASVTYVPPSITVTALGNTTTLTPGASIDITIPFVGSVTISMGVPSVTTSADGTTAVGDLSLLSIGVTLLGGLGTASFDVLPLHAEAHAPTNGVQCGLLDAPVITGPTEGSTTEDTTPTITGTGVPGATVTVREGTTVLGTAVVAADGTWSLTPATPLPLGDHEIVATQTLGGATSGPSNTPTFTIVDETPPPAPVIETPPDGSTTSDSTPIISGTAEAGSEVEVIIDGAFLGTTTAAADGTWSIPVTSPLIDGSHTVTATATDASGNESPAASNDFTVDTQAAAPVIETPADGSTTTDPTPLVEGTAEPGAAVQVSIDGVVVDTVTAGPDGSWSLQLTDPLADGAHTVTAVQTDIAGNTSPSTTNDFVVDTTAPAAPVITGPDNGATIGDNTPTITGTAEPGASVAVGIDGQPVGTVVADENGQWSIEVTTPLADGPHQVSATATDAAGNESAAAQTTFIVDTDVAAPTIDEPASGTVTNDSTPEISGTGEPGATVTVTTSAGDVLGEALVAGDGTWTLPLTDPLPDGTYTITATQVDQGGNDSPESSPVIFTVDTTIDAPVITSPADGSLIADATPTITGTAEPGAEVLVTVDDNELGTVVADPVTGAWSIPVVDALTDGPHTVTAVATDPAGNVSAPTTNDFTVDATVPDAPVIETPADGSTTDDTTPLVAGTAEPGSTVTVVVDGLEVGTATADVNGDWSLPLTDPLPDGVHVVTATATDAAGNEGPADSNTFTVDTAVPAPPTIITPVDGSTTSDTTPQIVGTAEPGATVVVSIDGTEVGTVTADASGAWTLPLTDPLADGGHTVSATQTDAAGNTSDPASNDFTVDTSAPDAPVVTAPADGSTTSDSTPTVRGTAEPGSTVTVVIDGDVVGTAVAGPLGNWQLPLVEPLDDGPHTVTATATDAAGNESPASEPVTFFVDATAPTAPTIETPADGSTTNDTTPEVSGVAEPGSTVTVLIDGSEVGTVVAAADGSWTLPLATPLTEGAHTVSATATDEAGNTSPAASNDFTVDLTDPDAPVITAPADGSVTGDSTPTIVGTAEPGATVEVVVDGTVVGSVVADAAGQWFIDVATPLADGAHTVTATQTDPAGNPSSVASNDFTVDTTVAAPIINIPANGTITDDSTPMISGTGEPGAVVTVVTSDGVVLGTATVDVDGNWQLTSIPLPDGTYTITASQVDLVGNASDDSSAKIFTVDTAVAPPMIETPADGSLTGDATPEVSGTAEPGSTVTVVVDGLPVGTAEADPVTGDWSLQLTIPLADGLHTVEATATDLAGNISAPASNDFTVDTTAPDAPVIETPADGAILDASPPSASGTAEPGATVDVYVDGDLVGTVLADGTGAWTIPLPALTDGLHIVSATATDAAGNTSASTENAFTVDTAAPDGPVITGPADGSTVGDSTPTITGLAEPGAEVEVLVDGVLVGTVTADPVTGAWSVVVTDPLADGAHTITATQTDLAGNISAPTTSTFTVDTTAAAPTIDPSINGMVTNDDTPTIFGTGEPGAVVTVTWGDVVLGTATVDGTGNWTLDAPPLEDGVYTVVATQVDASGNPSPTSSPAIFTVDTTVVAPVITSPATDEVVGTSTPTITGTAEPGATVVVLIDGVVVDTVVADGTGAWSVVSPVLTDGDHTVAASQTDPAGNTSPVSEPTPFVVDTTAPDAPTIDSPADGSVIDDPLPVISGTAEPGATVEVLLDGASLGIVVADGNGDWQMPTTTPLSDGLYSVVAIATDAAGNESAAATSTFTVDTVAPAPPTITGPADGSTIGDNTPTVTGQAEPGSTVLVTVDGTTYETTADPVTGAWTVEVTAPLDDGTYTVSATATDEAGNTSQPATSEFTVDTQAAAPVITGPDSGSVTNDTTPTISGTGEPGATVTVTVNDGTVVLGTAVVAPDGTWTLDSAPLPEGTYTIVATQVDELGHLSPASSPVILTIDTTVAPPVITSPAPDEPTGDATPEITGTAEPGATVAIVIDGQPAGTTTADQDGNWTFTPDEPLLDGDHTVAATQTDLAGNISEPSAEVPFVVDTTPPAAPVIETPADGAVIRDTTPVISGTGEPGATVVVEVDGVVVGTVTVDDDGNWAVPVTEPLGPGEHSVSATQTDAAGNESAVASTTFEVATTGPPAPVITSPTDGGSTTDTTPTVTGTGKPGAVVTVIVDGAVVGTTVVGPDGTWSFTLTEPLACGTHQVTATQTVTRGGRRLTSPPTDVVTLRIACPPGDDLGGTGADAGLSWLAPAGAFLVLLGSVLLRRRRPERRWQ